MKQEELNHKLTEFLQETKEGKLKWTLEVQTSEGNDASEKPVETEEDEEWTVDECYVSYHCKSRDTDFCMITYELIRTSGERVKTSNMVFIPPMGVRFFDLRTLLPHSVETSAVLVSKIHQLWELLLEMYKADRGSVALTVRPGVLTIEEEQM